MPACQKDRQPRFPRGRLGLARVLGEEFLGVHPAAQAVEVSVRDFTELELPVERAERERLLGRGFFLDRQGGSERAAAARGGQACEAFAQAAGAGEEVDDGDAGVVAVRHHGRRCASDAAAVRSMRGGRAAFYASRHKRRYGPAVRHRH